jgi:hypothetical protein
MGRADATGGAPVIRRSTLLRLARAGCNAAEIAAGTDAHPETVARALAALERAVPRRIPVRQKRRHQRAERMDRIRADLHARLERRCWRCFSDRCFTPNECGQEAR